MYDSDYESDQWKAEWKEVCGPSDRGAPGEGLETNGDRPFAWTVAANCSASPEEGGVQDPPEQVAQIAKVCDELKHFLIAKNKSYGASVFKPIGVFSRLPAREQILVRIDDKLSRLRSGTPYPGDDTVKDLAGYLIILMVYDLMEDT